MAVVTTAGDNASPSQSSGSHEVKQVPSDPIKLRLRKIAALEGAVAMTVRPGDDRLYVASKAGRIYSVVEGKDPELLLDISERVLDQWEQGFLGMVFDPRGSHLYVSFTDREEHIRVIAYPFDSSNFDAEKAREILAVRDPHRWHNAGHLVFQDGHLFIAMGDGGPGFDYNAQRLDTPFGSILRVDPSPAAPEPYSIPDDNPFVGRRQVHAEKWVFGLRNPWRFSFDRQTGDLWISDVGDKVSEEINFLSRTSKGGGNFGWPALEGTHETLRFPEPASHIHPIYEYGHGDKRCVAVVGGYVYRGSAIPKLRGIYVFGDFCDGKLRGLVHGRDETQLVELDVPVVPQLSSFGEGHRGELYVLSLSSGISLVEAG